MAHLPILIILCPLAAALICPLVSYFNRVIGRFLVIIGAGLSLCFAILLLRQVIENGQVHYYFGNWKPPYGIEFAIDSINGVLAVLVAFMGFMSTIYALAFMEGNSRLRSSGFYSILSLLIVGLLGMTLTGDVFNLYVFLEITSLSGYALIAMGGDKGVLSAFRYLLIGTIGASFYLLGVAFLYGETGTLNMADMADIITPLLSNGTTMIAIIFFTIGFGIKMALFPLHGWQPAAYTNAHPGAAPLIAGVMGKIPAYAMLRFFYFVFKDNGDIVKEFLVIIGIMSACSMIYGSLKAIQQRDIRRMLAYSSIAQIGYIGIGMAMGNFYGLIGAVLHIINHSFMKGGLFFCAGAINYRYKITAMKNMGQIYKKMPKTVVVIVLAALSMVGIPPTAGFFSKWYLALGAASSHQYIYIAVLVLSSLLNAIYFFRLLENIFMNQGRPEIVGEIEEESVKKKELPFSLMMPIILCGLGIILLGLCNTWFVSLLTSTVMGVV